MRFGEYQLLKRLGAGATAEVWLAAGPTPAHVELLALKVMFEHLTTREEQVRAFLKEARTSSLLRHPNLVEVFLVGDVEGRPFLAMELVRGWSVSALLKKLKAAHERLSINEAAELVRQAALGLHFAHQATGPDGAPLGLVHRDVSPQNVMVTEDGVAKVVDFGLAKATLTQETASGALQGKLKYMPPEQLKRQPVDRRSDVFALGAVLWELVCGAALYPGPSEADVFQQALFIEQPHPDEVQKGLPRSLVELLRAAVERTVEKRTPTMAALAEALAPLSSSDARERLAQRVGALFEPFPRSLAEATGEVGGRVPAGARRPWPPASSLEATLPPAAVLEPGTNPSLGRREGPIGSHELTRQAEAPTGPVEVPPQPNAASSPTLPAVGEPSGITHPDGWSTLTMADDALPAGLRPRWRRVSRLAASAAVGIMLVGAAIGALRRSRPFDPTLAPSPGTAPGPVDAGPPAALPAVAPPGPAAAAATALPQKAGPGARHHLGTLELTSNVPALVRERDLDLGLTPLTVSLPGGRHRLSLATPDGSLSTELDVTVPAGGVVRRSVRLTTSR